MCRVAAFEAGSMRETRQLIRKAVLHGVTVAPGLPGLEGACLQSRQRCPDAPHNPALQAQWTVSAGGCTRLDLGASG